VKYSSVPISTLFIFADQYFEYPPLGTHYSTSNNNIMSLYYSVYRYFKIISKHLPAIVCICRMLSNVFQMVTFSFISFIYTYNRVHTFRNYILVHLNETYDAIRYIFFLKYFIQLIIPIFIFIKFRYRLNCYLLNVVAVTVHSIMMT